MCFWYKVLCQINLLRIFSASVWLPVYFLLMRKFQFWWSLKTPGFSMYGYCLPCWRRTLCVEMPSYFIFFIVYNFMFRCDPSWINFCKWCEAIFRFLFPPMWKLNYFNTIWWKCFYFPWIVLLCCQKSTGYISMGPFLNSVLLIH